MGARSFGWRGSTCLPAARAARRSRDRLGGSQCGDRRPNRFGRAAGVRKAPAFAHAVSTQSSMDAAAWRVRIVYNMSRIVVSLSEVEDPVVWTETRRSVLETSSTTLYAAACRAYMIITAWVSDRLSLQQLAVKSARNIVQLPDDYSFHSFASAVQN